MNSVPDQYSFYPGGQHNLVFFTKCGTPVGQVAAWRRLIGGKEFRQKGKIKCPVEIFPLQLRAVLLLASTSALFFFRKMIYVCTMACVKTVAPKSFQITKPWLSLRYKGFQSASGAFQISHADDIE